METFVKELQAIAGELRQQAAAFAAAAAAFFLNSPTGSISRALSLDSA